MRSLMFLLVLGICSSSFSDEISVLSWNVESGGNDADTISDELGELNEGAKYDLICLTEVRSSNADEYEDAVEVNNEDYTAVTSASGGSDRIMLLFRTSRFTRLDNPSSQNRPTELTSQDGSTFPGGNNRRPSLVKLKDSQNNNLEFIFMGNHLNRGTDSTRQKQARLLREWAEDNDDIPVVAVGDYNFDFEFNNLVGNQAMTLFIREDASDGGDIIWKWLIPNTTIEVVGSGGDRKIEIAGEFFDTNWSDRNNNGQDDFPDSFLDFAFVSGPAKNWDGECTVVVRDGDFPDDGDRSDHRPIDVVFSPPQTVVADAGMEAHLAEVINARLGVRPAGPARENIAAMLNNRLSPSNSPLAKSPRPQSNSIWVGEPNSNGTRMMLIYNPRTGNVNTIEMDRSGLLRKLSSVELD